MTTVRRAAPEDAAVLGRLLWDFNTEFETEVDDVELYPDEMLSEIARRLGFGELFDDAVGLTSA